MSRSPQTYSNHRRTSRLYHMTVQPLLLTYLIFVVVQLLRDFSVEGVFHLLFAVAVIGLSVSSRLMTLTVQNRVIRLEMELRLARLLPVELAARVNELKVGQLVALRFASDAELPELVGRTLAGEFPGADAIKKEIRDWQGDWLRA